MGTKSVVMTCRVEEDLKRDFDKTCDALGLSSSTALTLFMKRVVAEEGIPVDITLRKDREEQMLKRLLSYKEKMEEMKEEN